jgi:hypothetical protein
MSVQDPQTTSETPATQLLTKWAVASRMHCSTRTIEIWVKAGQFVPPMYVGRRPFWTAQSLEAWLSQKASEASSSGAQANALEAAATPSDGGRPIAQTPNLPTVSKEKVELGAVVRTAREKCISRLQALCEV